MGRTDEQTHRINGMHALIKFPEYIPYGLGVMAWTRTGTYGQTDRQIDGRTDRWMYGTDRGKTSCPSASLRIGVMATYGLLYGT